MPHQAPNLLNDDGSASMATALLMSHHGFRRDLALFTLALARLDGDAANRAALQGEWQFYRQALHHHHQAEDQQIFPQLLAQHPQLAPVIEQLSADHRRIDPLLDQGDRAFSQLPDTAAAAALVTELSTLLDAHLATEEAQAVPFLRTAKEFPPPEDAKMVELYAEGFAWTYHGVAPDVLARVDAMLPEVVTAKLPAARAAYRQRIAAAWGAGKAGASRTAVPDWLGG